MSESSPQDQPTPGEGGQHLRARIPDHVGEGVFSTGAIVVTGPTEFVLDFVQNISRPHRVATRVVLPHPVLPQFLDALRKNLDIYTGRFGPPADPPKPPTEGRRPSPQEIYDDLKMNDAILSGAYANGVMIGHGAAEFSLDFITSFFPQSAVSARVYMAAGQIPRLIESLDNAMKQLQIRGQQGGGQAPPPKPTPPPTDSPGDDLLPPNENRPDSDDPA